MSDGRKTAWTPERRAAHAVRMIERWRDPDYRRRHSEASRAVMLRPENRAAKSAQMKELNARMKTDVSLKGAVLAGIHRSYLSGKRQQQLSEKMKETMRRPEQRARNAEHCRRISRIPEVKKRQWDGRRGFALPDELRDDYRNLVQKVGAAEARRIIRDEIIRTRKAGAGAKSTTRSAPEART